jgi:hypothetical protein
MQLTDADRMRVEVKSRMRRRAWIFAGFLAGVPLSFATGAMAQYDPEDYGYGMPRFNPYGRSPYDYDEGGPGPGYRGRPERAGVVPVAVLERRIRSAGFRLIAPPRHKGNIYLAEVEDRNEIRHRLVYDAYSGELLENTPLGPVKKKPTSDVNKVPKEAEPQVRPKSELKSEPKVETKPESKPARATKAVEPKKAEPAAAEQSKPIPAPVVPAETSKVPEQPAAKAVEQPAPKPVEEPAHQAPAAATPSIVDDALKPAQAPAEMAPAPATSDGK